MKWIENLRQAKLNRFEIAGSVGDMGTFLPLLVAMVARCGLDLTSALFFAGIFNVCTGLLFTIPMAVQPMKAIATIAITENLTAPQILAAGILTSAIIFILGITNLIEWVNRYIPKSVIRGLQLALGLKLLLTGLQYIAGTQTFWGWDSISVGILCFLAILLFFFSSKIPGALVVFLAGFVFLFFRDPVAYSHLSFQFDFPHWVPISRNDFIFSFWKATIPQIPLTTLNSVIAVSALSSDLFPARSVKIRTVAISVGLMNLVSGWFGAMPMCHGAGGLAGQYRFGARTNGSILFLGIVKIILAVCLGATLLQLLISYPLSVLGVLLLFSGFELALVARDINNKNDFFIMLLTTSCTLAFDSVALGFSIGLTIGLLFSRKIFTYDNSTPSSPSPPKSV